METWWKSNSYSSLPGSHYPESTTRPHFDVSRATCTSDPGLGPVILISHPSMVTAAHNTVGVFHENAPTLSPDARARLSCTLGAHAAVRRSVGENRLRA